MKNIDYTIFKSTFDISDLLSKDSIQNNLTEKHS